MTFSTVPDEILFTLFCQFFLPNPPTHPNSQKASCNYMLLHTHTQTYTCMHAHTHTHTHANNITIHVKTWTHMQNNHTRRHAHCVSKYGDRHMKARQTMKLCLCWPISKLPQPIGPLYVSLGLFSCCPFSFSNPGSGSALVLCFVAVFPFYLHF